MKILAVDDDTILLELLVETLSSFDYKDVTTELSGNAALKLIESIEADSSPDDPPYFDCILLDIQMPGMDGIELCGKIRALPNYRRIPIIMITAMSDRRYIDGAFRAGATDYITKPFEMTEFGARIRMAHMYVTEQKKALENYFAVRALGKGDEDDSTVFEKPYAIEGLEGVVDYLVLENYLLSLSSAKAYRTMAVGFKYVEAETAAATLSEADFVTLLGEISSIIAPRVRSAGGLMSYFGSGFFVCILEKTMSGVIEDLTVSVSEAIEESGLDLEHLGPTLVSSGPITNSIKLFGSPHSLILRALEKATEAANPPVPKITPKRPEPARAMRYNVLR